MVYLGGPRGRSAGQRRGIYLHDPPPGYRRPHPRVPLKDRQRMLRRDAVLLYVLIAVLAVLVVGFVVMMLLAAMHV